MSNLDRPTQFDVVLGSREMATQGSLILGGIDGIKQRLNSPSLHVKLAALEDAVNYGTAGLELVIDRLEDLDLHIQNRAYELLESRSESWVLDRLADRGIRRYTRHKQRCDLFEQLGRDGTPENIDIMMNSLELDPASSPYKLVDYALGLVRSDRGKNRIEHYLFNGTQVQRNYACLYFKRLGNTRILQQAVKMGCIDRLQAFSK